MWAENYFMEKVIQEDTHSAGRLVLQGEKPRE